MALEQAHRGTCTPKGPGGGGRDRKLPASLPAAPGSGARAPLPGCPPSRRQLLQLFPVLHELRQTLLDLLLPDGVVVGQLLSSVQDTLTDENEGLTARPCFSMLPGNGFSTAFRAAPSWLGMRRPKRRRDRREMNTSKGLRGAWRGPPTPRCPLGRKGPAHLNCGLVRSQLGLQPFVLLPQVLHTCQVSAIVLRAHQQLLLPG